MILGQHFFQPNPVTGSGVSPVWDFRSNPRFAGNADAYVLGKVNSSIASPTDATNDVTWLHVENVQGELADVIFRYDTVGGQPPASVSPTSSLDNEFMAGWLIPSQCTFGNDTNISVKYVAKYGEWPPSDFAARTARLTSTGDSTLWRLRELITR